MVLVGDHVVLFLVWLISIYRWKKLEAMARMRMEENKAAVAELLEARSMKPAAGVFFGVKQEVDEECEKRGSLLLGTIPEFTYDLVRGFSGRWSWVD